MVGRDDAPNHRRHDARLHQRDGLRSGSGGSVRTLVVGRLGSFSRRDGRGGDGMKRTLAVGSGAIVG
jgi:hypothetical protein